MNVYQNGAFDDSAIVTVLSILEAVDAQANAQKMTERYCDEARQTIDRLALTPSAKHDLEGLLQFLVGRNL